MTAAGWIEVALVAAAAVVAVFRRASVLASRRLTYTPRHAARK